MRGFRSVIQEIYVSITGIYLFDAALSSAMVFIIFAIVYSLIGLRMWIAVLPAVVFLVSRSIFIFTKDMMRILESEYPCKEQLITARDYVDIRNEFVPELQHEAVEVVRTVNLARFFDEKRTTLKIGTIMVLLFLMLMLAPYQFVIFDLHHVIDETIKRSPLPNIPIFNRPPVVLTPAREEWYGEFSLADLNEEDNMQIQMEESKYKLLSSVVNDPEQKEFTEEFPEEVSTKTAASYKSNIAKENQEIVKNYFRDIAKE